MANMLFCVNCDHCVRGMPIRCGHPSSARGHDPVTGDARENWPCESQRGDDRACGPSGKWFEDIKF